jgi:hypothetical protein
MESLLKTLTDHAATAIAILAIAVLALAIVTGRLAAKLRKTESRWRDLLPGVRGDNLERLLEHHLREKIALDEELARTKKRVDELEENMRHAKRHLGLVRYDAFEDVGGSQSFALALCDDEGDGAVLNGLIGRTDCRVYCKSITRSSSDRHLSKEELEAIRDARRADE